MSLYYKQLEEATKYIKERITINNKGGDQPWPKR